ncbi:putative spermidine/putrescine transport system permease protein [Bradyrhizobium sp. USDA 4532]|uniref:ABC transporter permease n=1 Tax=unclassified Bradyrhizobium TaxID=2631580 RepID=UPI0020A017A0|nr:MULTISPECIES: ABC transporter permease [unclassified Bradyrhizobium]MCP1835550.1 putative spermidine/putrescine transport system permease protein [Bradyrhizobium sp. USDA 4545]MCP1920297.1 putative spermidine/putrescine transport system permease protein [Bradyrhizobium sp. USDA 4532]
MAAVKLLRGIVKEPLLNRRNMTIAILLAPAVLLLIACLVVPVLGLLRSSFLSGNHLLDGTGFSLQQYMRIFSEPFYSSILIETFVDGLLVALVCLVIGFPTGYSLARLPPRARRWRTIIVILPLTLSLVVVVFGWLIILGRNGLLNSLFVKLGIFSSPKTLLFSRPAVIIVLVQQFLPFMILSVMSVVTQIDPVLEQAAANLHANRFVTFRKVIIPLALPGILVGFNLVFVLSISAFITPRLIGGSRVAMFGSLIYERIMVELNWPSGAALAFVLFVFVLSFTAALNALAASRFIMRGQRYAV